MESKNSNQPDSQMSHFRFYIKDNARNGKLWNGNNWVDELNGSQKGYSSEAGAIHAARKLLKNFRALSPEIVESINGWVK